MTAINISSDIATSFTTVSDIFIDQYMPKANGEFVKVYLYLLRATGSGAGIATISEIADHFSNTEADIIRALNYWASEGILQVQTGADGQIIGINLCSLSVSGMQAAQSNIQSAVAERKDKKEADGIFCAFIESTGELYKEDLRNYLRNHLPEYKIPDLFIRVDKLPRNRNGKVDYSLLPNLESVEVMKDPYIPPRNETEDVLEKIFYL